MTKKETMAILEMFFNDCLKYWKKTLTTNEAYKKALAEIPKTNPYKPSGEKLNEEWVSEFRKYRLMDCYGNDWENHI